MSLGTLLRDLVAGLAQAPATRQYPAERQAAPDRLRGELTWDPAKCTGCGLCVKDCPCAAIELITLDKAAKRFVMRYHVDRCVFCSQCVLNCRFKCLELSPTRWEMAALTREHFSVLYGKQPDVDTVLERVAPANPEAAG